VIDKNDEKNITLNFYQGPITIAVD
jgi:hypothetical protein